MGAGTARLPGRPGNSPAFKCRLYFRQAFTKGNHSMTDLVTLGTLILLKL